MGDCLACFERIHSRQRKSCALFEFSGPDKFACALGRIFSRHAKVAQLLFCGNSIALGWDATRYRLCGDSVHVFPPLGTRSNACGRIAAFATRVRGHFGKLVSNCACRSSRGGDCSNALFNTLSDAERAMRDINPDDAVALDLVRELHGYLERLDSQRKPAEARPSWK